VEIGKLFSTGLVNT